MYLCMIPMKTMHTISNETLQQYTDLLKSNEKVTPDIYLALLSQLNPQQQDWLRQQAAQTAVGQFGKGIYVRALIEISNYCKNNCYYCGIRCANTTIQRYRLTQEQIIEACQKADQLGFKTFVLQGGEDPLQDDEWMVQLITNIKTLFPQHAITLSIGERDKEAYRRFKQAGADRFLLRHETYNAEHYAQLHPHNMSRDNRINCLRQLKELGYQTGTGIMVGSPYQTMQDIVEDILFMEQLQPEMIGIGPFIATPNTPFEQQASGTVDQTTLLLALLRLRFPKALIPATTALTALDDHGREKAILSGANVIMPNVSPPDAREKYAIYTKKNIFSETADAIADIQNRVNNIGYHIDWTRGDYPLTIKQQNNHV